MKARRSSAWLGAAGVALAAGAITTAGSAMAALPQTVTIPDPGLEEAVRTALAVEQGAISREAMAELTELRAVGKKINDLTGLEQARGLRKLVLGANQISDLTPLAGLSELTEFHVWFNRIEDVSPLAGLTNLRQLQLAANQITDLRPLAGLTGLTHLDLAFNGLADVAPLAGLANLRWLDLSDNEIADVSGLARLVGLRKLWIWRNRLVDVSPLAFLAELRWLEIGANHLGDISAVLRLQHLTTLSVQDNFLNLDDFALSAALQALTARGALVRAEPQHSVGFWATPEEGPDDQ